MRLQAKFATNFFRSFRFFGSTAYNINSFPWLERSVYRHLEQFNKKSINLKKLTEKKFIIKCRTIRLFEKKS